MSFPKGKLMVLLAVFAAIGIITATGAFTTVTADRSATVNVAGDASALVQLTPYDGPNGYNGGSAGSSDGYADIQDGTLVIDLGGYSAGTPEGQGLNIDARTSYDNVFNITNNADSDVSFTLELNGDHPQYVTLFKDDTHPYDEANNVTGATNSFTLISGQTATISIQVDLVAQDFSGPLAPGDSLIDSISITANRA